MPTFRCRVLSAPLSTATLADLADEEGYHALPDVDAPTSQEAAELASQWYGEPAPTGADGSYVSSAKRIVEVREEGGLPEVWQRFVVTKHLVVERKAAPLDGFPTAWTTVLKAAWAELARCSGRKLSGEVAAFTAWESQGRVLFAVRFAQAGEVQFVVDAGLATRVVRALLPHWIEWRATAGVVALREADEEAEACLRSLGLTVAELRELASYASGEAA